MEDFAAFLPESILAPRRAAMLIGLVALATLGGAWAFQMAGFAPCELCLKQRIPYYIGVLVAGVVVVLAGTGQVLPTRLGLGVLALVFAGSMVFGIYHTGVEWHLWQGPTACTGSFTAAPSMQGFMKQLQSVQVTRCDVVSLHVFGLSLATWNAVISLGLAALAVRAAQSAA